jgi:hypothetical protein
MYMLTVRMYVKIRMYVTRFECMLRFELNLLFACETVNIVSVWSDFLYILGFGEIDFYVFRNSNVELKHGCSLIFD